MKVLEVSGIFGTMLMFPIKFCAIIPDITVAGIIYCSPAKGYVSRNTPSYFGIRPMSADRAANFINPKLVIRLLLI